MVNLQNININNINNDNNFTQNQINDPNLINKLQLLSKNQLLQNIQQNKIPQKSGQMLGQNQINNINNIANNNNNLQLLNNNLNYAMNMGVNNCYNNINIYNLSPAQIEQLNQTNQEFLDNKIII